MLLLPTFNARLNPCPVSPAEFTPHPQGNFCEQCQRVVHDFSQSTNPRADLAAARAAAPDGRVCGSFGREQLAKPPILTLSRRLRWFMTALVLVVAQGLTAREALAQVRRGAIKHRTLVARQQPPLRGTQKEIRSIEPTVGIVAEELPLSPTDTASIRVYAEVMPTLQGRNYQETVAYIQQQVHWPKGTGMTDAEGRVFVQFIVGRDGQVRGAEIVKGIHPLLDAEALRVVQTLSGFMPGRQNGKAVPIRLTVPIAFLRK